MYRLVVCDLDGTVLTYDSRLSPVVGEAMQAVVDAGVWITIGTGRGYQTLRRHLGSVPVNAPLICCNGGLIIEPATREVLHTLPMPLALAHKVLRACQEEGLEALVSLDDLQTVLHYQPSHARFLLRRHGTIIRENVDPADEMARAPHKVLVMTEYPDLTAAAIARVQESVKGEARVLASGPVTIELAWPGISKAWALSWLAAFLGVAREHTIAIGDGNNDVEMVNWAGLGIAMGNATPAVKDAADWIAPDVDEGGLAAALRQFVLNL